MDVRAEIDRLFGSNRWLCAQMHEHTRWHHVPYIFGWRKEKKSEFVKAQTPEDERDVNFLRAAARAGLIREDLRELQHLWSSSGDYWDGGEKAIYLLTWTRK